MAKPRFQPALSTIDATLSRFSESIASWRVTFLFYTITFKSLNTIPYYRCRLPIGVITVQLLIWSVADFYMEIVNAKNTHSCTVEVYFSQVTFDFCHFTKLTRLGPESVEIICAVSQPGIIRFFWIRTTLMKYNLISILGKI